MTSNKLRDFLYELDPTPLTAGLIIRAIRKNFNVTLKELETLTGIKEPNLSAIENDKIEMTKHYAEIIAAALGINPNSLLFPEGRKKSKAIKAIERKAAILMEKKKKYKR